MAAIPQAKDKKYAPPENATPEWLIRQMYTDIRELKEIWCPRISRTEMIVGGLAIIVGIMFLVVFLALPGEIAQALANFFHIS